MGFFGKKLFTLGLVVMVLGSVPLHAQNAPMGQRPPVMRSIFWNTLMGSAWGAIMGASVALNKSDNSSKNVRESLVVGTTVGGMLGYGFGIFLVIRGITFDPSTLPVPPITPLGAIPLHSPHVVHNEIVPFSAEMRLASRPPPMQWQTTIFQMTF